MYTLIGVHRGNHWSLRNIDRVPQMMPGTQATLNAPR